MSFKLVTPFHLTLLLLLAALGLGAQKVSFSELENLTTSGRIQSEVPMLKANNYLDITYFKGKYYLAFRTAPTHFASKKTLLVVLSSADRRYWTVETQFAFGADIREPRFCVLGDTLLLYFFIGGTKPLKFEPREICLAKTNGSGWSGAQNIGLDGYVPWRVRSRNDTLFMSAYYGKNLYEKNHRADLRIFISTNGNKWQPISKSPQIDLPHAEEGEFIFGSDSCFYAVVRLESNGALVCKGQNCAIDQWETKRTKYKYDSALLFEHNSDIYLVSRRNLDGEMDKIKKRKNDTHGRMRNLIRYSITKKVTALFKLDKENLTLHHVLDFPSTGDNAFPAIVKLDDKNYWLMNYSSDITKRKKSWLVGQFSKTFIYETVLTFND